MSNRGAEELAKLIHPRGEQTRLAEAADIDVGYLGRLAKADREAGLEVRKKLQKLAGIPMQWWDEEPTPEQLEERARREAAEIEARQGSEPPPAADAPPASTRTPAADPWADENATGTTGGRS